MLRATALGRIYPEGFFPLLSIQLFFMIGFALIQSLLVLYVTSTLHFSDQAAYSLYAAYGSLIFGMPLLGGYIGGNLIGYKAAARLGLILSALGLFGLACPGQSLFYAGLSLFVLGTSLAVTNIYCLIGQLYTANDHRRESGFTLAYMGMNIGGLLAMAASGMFQQRFGYHEGFVVGGIALIIALILFFSYQNYFTEGKAQNNPSPTSYRYTYVLLLLAIPLGLLLLKHPNLCKTVLFSAGTFAFLYTLHIAYREQGIVREKLLLFLSLLLVCLAFWSIYMLAPTALTLFIERNVDRQLFGWLIPTSSIMSLNPFFIVSVGIIVNAFYLKCKNSTLSISTKIALGTILMGLGYVVLIFGIHSANVQGYVAFSWIVLSYFLQTTGELFVGPIGFAMVGSLVPTQLEGIMMGMWQLSLGVSSSLSGVLANSTTLSHATAPLLTNAIYDHAFAHFGLVALGIGVLALVISIALPMLRQSSVRNKALLHLN